MSDRALNNAKTKKKQLVEARLELNKRLTELDTEIGEVEQFIKAWHQFADEGSSTTHGYWESIDQNKPEISESRTKRVSGNSRKEDVAQTARDIILERNSPMNTEDLYDALIARGMRIDGKDPKGVLTTMLWRMSNVIGRVPDGRYWPIGMEVDKARPGSELQFDAMQTYLDATSSLLYPQRDDDDGNI